MLPFLSLAAFKAICAVGIFGAAFLNFWTTRYNMQSMIGASLLDKMSVSSTGSPSSLILPAPPLLPSVQPDLLADVPEQLNNVTDTIVERMNELMRDFKMNSPMPLDFAAWKYHEDIIWGMVLGLCVIVVMWKALVHVKSVKHKAKQQHDDATQPDIAAAVAIASDGFGLPVMFDSQACGEETTHEQKTFMVDDVPFQFVDRVEDVKEECTAHHAAHNAPTWHCDICREMEQARLLQDGALRDLKAQLQLVTVEAQQSKGYIQKMDPMLDAIVAENQQLCIEAADLKARVRQLESRVTAAEANAQDMIQLNCEKVDALETLRAVHVQTNASNRHLTAENVEFEQRIAALELDKLELQKEVTTHQKVNENYRVRFERQLLESREQVRFLIDQTS